MPKSPQASAAKDVRREEQTSKYDPPRLVPTLVTTASILFACISAQTILFAFQIEANFSVYVALNVAALVAFGASAFLVARILRAVSFAADSLGNLAKPEETAAPESARLRRAERQDAIGRLLAAPGEIATRIEAAANEIERLKEIDPLTGLGNRWWLQWRAKQEFVRAQREGSPISMVVVKIDRLDDINANFGHHAGNTALLTVADALRDFVRPYDLVGRISGDAFGVVLPGASQESAAGIADRLQRAIANRTLTLLGDRSVSARVSIVERETGDVWFEQFFERGNMELRTKP